MENKTNVVIDTSIYIETFKGKSETSISKRIFKKAANNEFIIIISPQILREIIDVATRNKHGYTEDFIENFLRENKNCFCSIAGKYKSYELDRIDEKDNIILAAGLEGKADYIISSDKHILDLKKYHKIRITNPVDFMKEIDQFNATKQKNKIRQEAIIL
ncbi:MAG: hypothetical protein RLZZ203_2071 [Cyanobacteriota bacterium]|jgi:putative PIN family toxin of toxin-antitoxin system